MRRDDGGDAAVAWYLRARSSTKRSTSEPQDARVLRERKEVETLAIAEVGSSWAMISGSRPSSSYSSVQKDEDQWLPNEEACSPHTLLLVVRVPIVVEVADGHLAGPDLGLRTGVDCQAVGVLAERRLERRCAALCEPLVKSSCTSRRSC